VTIITIPALWISGGDFIALETARDSMGDICFAGCAHFGRGKFYAVEYRSVERFPGVQQVVEILEKPMDSRSGLH